MRNFTVFLLTHMQIRFPLKTSIYTQIISTIWLWVATNQPIKRQAATFWNARLRNAKTFSYFLLHFSCQSFRDVSPCRIFPSIIFRLSYRCDKRDGTLPFTVVAYTYVLVMLAKSDSRVVLLHFDSAKLNSIIRIETLDKMEYYNH